MMLTCSVLLQTRFKVEAERDVAREASFEYLRLLRHARHQLEVAGQKRRQDYAAAQRAKSKSGLRSDASASPLDAGNSGSVAVDLPLPSVLSQASLPGHETDVNLARSPPRSSNSRPPPTPTVTFAAAAAADSPGKLPPLDTSLQQTDVEKMRFELVSSAEALWKCRRNNAKLKAKVEMYRQRLGAIQSRLRRHGDKADESTISDLLDGDVAAEGQDDGVE